MRWLWIVLLILLLGLQIRLWVGEGSLAQVDALEQRILQQQQKNARLQQRNQALEQEVRELQTGMQGIEEKARQDMGLIKQGETFYLDAQEQNNE